MTVIDRSWKAFLARTVVAAAIVGAFVAGAVVVGVKLAGADPSGPPTRSAFTFAGVLRHADGGVTTTATMLTFVFHRAGQPDCTPPAVMATPNASGAFSVLVPIDSAPCTGTFFNGADVTYDVLQGTESLTPDGGVPITPVPYARFADQAGVNNDCPPEYEVDRVELTRDRRVCRKRLRDGVYDEVVGVGYGASSFWINVPIRG